MASMLASSEGEGEDVEKLEYGGIINADTYVLSNDGALSLINQLKSRGYQTDTIQQTYDYLKQVGVCTTSVADDANNIHQQANDQLSALTLSLKEDVMEGGGGDEDKDNKASLYKFEIAALINLVREDSDKEEVKAWIPSLVRFDEIDVQQAINIVKDVKGQFTQMGL